MSSREKLWTPGPWDNKEITICDQDLIGISFSFLNTANRGRYEEGVANGRLMKAAPDLVEALELVRTIIVDGAPHGFNPLEGDWAERLFQSQQVTSAALRKAYGGSQ